MKQKLNIWQRLLSALLVLVMTIGLLPQNALPAKAAVVIDVPSAGESGYINISKNATTVYQNGDTSKPYAMGDHVIRKYHFIFDETKWMTPFNEEYGHDPSNVMYCIEYNVKLPNSTQYVACNPNEVNTWFNWSKYTKEALMLILGHGFPYYSI